MEMILKSFNLFFFWPVLSAFNCCWEPERLHLKLFRQLRTYLSIVCRESTSQGQLDMFNWSDPELPEQDYSFFWWCFPRLAVEVVRCVWCVLLVSHLPTGMQKVRSWCGPFLRRWEGTVRGAGRGEPANSAWQWSYLWISVVNTLGGQWRFQDKIAPYSEIGKFCDLDFSSIWWF